MSDLSCQRQFSILYNALQLKQCYKMELDTGFSVILGTLCAANGDDGGTATPETDGIFGSIDDIEAVELLEASIKNLVDPGQISESLIFCHDSNQ